MLKFLKREIVTLKISDNKIEIVSDKKEVTSIKREFISLGEDLDKIKKFFIKKDINILLEDDIFIKKVFLDKEEVSEINIKKYIEQEILENLSEEKDFYFSCYFFDKDENCEIFIGEDIFISTLIEYIIKNNLSILKICVSNEKYILKDYEKLLKNSKKSNFSKIIVGFILLLLFIFIFNFFYKKNLEKRLGFLKNEYYSKEKILDSKKKELEDIKEKITVLEKEKAKKNISYKKFIDEIFWIINILPRTCEIKNLYWEKGSVILEGKSQNIEEIFKFATKLEKDKRIENINFDSILEKDKNYEFVIEMRVENGGA